ncbi:MAG: NAD-dependent DNA ligase LigA [Treponema sp.]|jgi:DNA ligase (NAD+)|nr:NAD-dependent DNA ligase LigA [Treponema sp.]
MKKPRMENAEEKNKNAKANGKDTITRLENLIKRYQKSYYNGEAEISDAEFDRLWDELKALDGNNSLFKKIGVDLSDGFPKARHLIPMGSQDKAANPAEFREWAAKAQFSSYVVQYKLDGASLELQYRNGVLEQAVTRGDGTVGDNITANALRMAGVIPKLDLPFSGGVRGEVVMTRERWQKKYRDKANCRNAANGLMRRKDGAGCEDLSLITYDASAPDEDSYFTDEMEKIAWLRGRGFTVTECREFSDAEAIIAYREQVSNSRSKLPYDIDGLVVKDRATDMADLRRTRPEKQIAFKFDLEEAVTVLRSVEWSESGATYTPIGIVDPVRLAGTTVQRANLNNPDMIRALGLKIGSVVTVVKRGEIIPKIESLASPEQAALLREKLSREKGETVKEQEIEFPARCGSCGTGLEDGGTRLFCPNPDCPKRLHHRLEKWISVLDIRELGEKLLRQLFDSGRIRHISDLYTLTAEELADYERMGELSASKVLRHIRTERELSLAAFIAGFDFEGVAELIMEKVVQAGFDTLEKLRSASAEELAAVYGRGEITARTIREGLRECEAEIDGVLASGIISIAAPPAAETQPLRAKSFCFTGELKTMKRGQAEEKVKALGGSVKSSVVKDLSYLVTNDPESGSAKNAKARSLGVPILDEEQFLSLLREGAGGEKG